MTFWRDVLGFALAAVIFWLLVTLLRAIGRRIAFWWSLRRFRHGWRDRNAINRWYVGRYELPRAYDLERAHVDLWKWLPRTTPEEQERWRRLQEEEREAGDGD